MLLYNFNLDARFIFFNISAIEMTLFRSNKETLAWTKGIKWRDMTQVRRTSQKRHIIFLVLSKQLGFELFSQRLQNL